MSEIRLIIDDKFIEGLKNDTGIDKASTLTTEALTLLKWVVSEIKKGRVILTTKEDGTDVKKVVLPSLEIAKARAHHEA